MRGAGAAILRDTSTGLLSSAMFSPLSRSPCALLLCAPLQCLSQLISWTRQRPSGAVLGGHSYVLRGFLWTRASLKVICEIRALQNSSWR